MVIVRKMSDCLEIVVGPLHVAGDIYSPVMGAC